MIAEVIPESKTFKDTDTFTYKVPIDLVSQIKVGSLVNIPFGNRTIRGIVASLDDGQATMGNGYKIKNIKSVEPSFVLPEKYIEIARWVADYYLCSLGEAIELFLPPVMRRPKASSQNTEYRIQNTEITLTKDQEEIFQKLKSKLNCHSRAGGNPELDTQVSPTSPSLSSGRRGNEPEDDNVIKPALIFGVTGSGKTEIYLKLAEEVIRNGKQVIVLVPEIMLTPQTVERFEKVFGDKITLMHHSLSKSEKYNCFYDFYTGRKPIIVGPRSALLVPSPNLGLIIVDEEHEDSYKQEQAPRYHAVQLAEKIAELINSLMLLGTATPRIETYYKTKTGQYDLFILSNRFQKETLPPAKIIDLRHEIRSGNLSPISEKLQAEIAEVLQNKKQVLLFLNRRGTATFVSCRDCGHIMLCKNCSIPLIYHVGKGEDVLSCHHCDHKEPVPHLCPKCQGQRIKFFGSGIEKIESEVRRLFPDARVVRIDSTTITSKHDYETFYQQLKNHEIDIVIGTQMIAKGLDIPGVDLVGIVSADTGLHLPHYRASERSFQLITQVSGRSGRREHIGQTVIQTYWPEAPAILAASKHDFPTFYESEIIERQTFGYPPFKHLVRIVSENSDQQKALALLLEITPVLQQAGLDFIGPGACFYERLHNKFRFHILIKLDKLPEARLKKLTVDFPNLTFDVEPTNLL